jgi:hypothetical protein
MNKAELKANLEKALSSWVDQVFCDECSDMEEFSFTAEVRRCECGQVRRMEVMMECRPSRCYEDDEDPESEVKDDYEDPETRGEIR